MLVLTRKSNQSIMIGDDIEVSVLAIMGEKVRIGIQAPRDIPVFRKEVYLEIQQEHAASGGPQGKSTRRWTQPQAQPLARAPRAASPSRRTASGTSRSSRGRPSRSGA